jgi:hypothetical protein
MESGGITSASSWASEFFRKPTIRTFSVRGISDLCNKKVDDIFRDLAADHAAAFLVGFLKDRYSSDL